MYEKKKYNKIRKYLGNDYHLCEEYPSGKWKLFLKYDGYLNDGSGPIMTSDDYTYEDLYKFAKKHREYDSQQIVFMVLFITSLILIGVSILNVFIHSVYLRGFLNGADFIIILTCITYMFVGKHNCFVLSLKIEERIKRIWETQTK